MSLQVWLPLNGNINNYGINNISSTNNGATVTSSGKIGSCYSFGNGSASSIGVELNSNFTSLLATEGSIAVWVNPAGNHYHYNGTIISSGNWNNSCWSFGLSQDNSQVDLFSGGYNCYLSCTVPTNTWTHLCCTRKNGITYLYKNGEYIGSKSLSNITSDASNTYIGRETYASGYFTFNGKLNDLRIYDTCLSEKEVKEIAKGLILHYKLDDAYAESTTNLNSSADLSSNAYNGATGKYSYGTSTDMYKTLGTFQGKYCCKLYMGTDNLSAYPYPFIDNITPAVSSYRTVSFDYYPTTLTTIVFYSYNTSCNFTWRNGSLSGTGGTVTVKTGVWNHIEMTIYNNGSATSGAGYIRIGSASHTSSTSNYWLFANIQIEDKDHATPFAGLGATRNATTMYDNSGYNHNGTLTGDLIPSYDTARFSRSLKYNASDGSILFGNLSTMVPEGIFTFNTWFKKVTGEWSSKSYETIFGGPSGFELEMKPGSSNTSKVRLYSWGGSDGSKDFTYSLDQWNMLTMVRTSSDTTWYLNGDQVQTASAGSIPSGNYFIGSWSSTSSQNYRGYVSDVRIYATALSATDIKELYNTSASIDNNGNLYTRELIEE